MNIKKTIPYSLVVIALVVGCEMQRCEFNRIEKKVDGLYAVCNIGQKEFKGVADSYDTGWIHDGWCTLMPCCNPRCICHDHCGPICSTWRKNVMDGIIPIDNGLAEGRWYIAEDVINLMKANLENRRIAKLSPEERTAHYERERERIEKEAKEGNRVVRLVDWMKEEEKRAKIRSEQVKKHYAELIEKMCKHGESAR